MKGPAMQNHLGLAVVYSVGIMSTAVGIIAIVYSIARYVPKVRYYRRLTKRLNEAKEREKKITECRAYLYENDREYRSAQNGFELIRRRDEARSKGIGPGDSDYPIMSDVDDRAERAVKKISALMEEDPSVTK
jgi:hypothetical protein